MWVSSHTPHPRGGRGQEETSGAQGHSRGPAVDTFMLVRKDVAVQGCTRTSAPLGTVKQIAEDVTRGTGRSQAPAFTLPAAEGQGQDLRTPAQQPEASRAVSVPGGPLQGLPRSAQGRCLDRVRAARSQGRRDAEGGPKAPPPPRKPLGFTNPPQPLAVTTGPTRAVLGRYRRHQVPPKNLHAVRLNPMEHWYSRPEHSTLANFICILHPKTVSTPPHSLPHRHPRRDRTQATSGQDRTRNAGKEAEPEGGNAGGRGRSER